MIFKTVHLVQYSLYTEIKINKVCTNMILFSSSCLYIDYANNLSMLKPILYENLKTNVFVNTKTTSVILFMHM